MTVLREDAMSGKVVLVSGGTQGIGAAAARTAAGCGAEAVIVTGRRPELAGPLIDQLDAGCREPLFILAQAGGCRAQGHVRAQQFVVILGRAQGRARREGFGAGAEIFFINF